MRSQPPSCLLTAALVFLAVDALAVPWRTELLGPFSSEVVDAAQDGAGDVFLADDVGHLPASVPAVVKLAGATGVMLWRTDVVGTVGADGVDVLTRLAVDGAGDVIAVGYVDNEPLANGDTDLVVVKLDGATGAEIWRTEIDGTAGLSNDQGLAVAVDPAGAVIVGGRVDETPPVTVVKLAGADGSELWRYGGGGPAAYALAVEPGGDVVAGGGDPWSVYRLDGPTGVEVWRQDIDPGGPTPTGIVNSVAVDSTGDVVAGGFLLNGISVDFTVAKFVVLDGTELWRTHVGGDSSGEAAVVRVAPGDDVVAAGLVARGRVFSAAARLDGVSGAIDWTYESRESDPSNTQGARGIGLDGAGDVLLIGTLRPSAFFVAKLDGALGAERWVQRVDGAAACLAVDPSGDPIVGGQGRTLMKSQVVRLNGLEGAIGHVAGRRLLVTDHASDPTRRQIVASLQDDSIQAPPNGSAGDPTVAGATLRLVNPDTAEAANLALPSSGWVALGSPPGSRGYRYLDRAGVNGPCRAVKLRAGQGISASCTGRSGVIPFTLDEPQQGDLSVSLQLGAAAKQCATFHAGAGVIDAGTSNPGPTGVYRAGRVVEDTGVCP